MVILFSILMSSFVQSQLDSTGAILETGSDDTIVWVGWGKQHALENIENDNLEILVPGGFIGSIIHDEDKEFEKKYNVKFIYQGCVQSPVENQIEYNRTIFRYLDKNTVISGENLFEKI